MPLAKASAPQPPSSEASVVSRFFRVGIAAPRIVELPPLAGLVLHKRRSDVNRRHDGPGRLVALLAHVNCPGSKLH